MTAIENQMNITVEFPDATLPTPTNGGFQTQEEFRQFVMEHQNGKWKTEFTSRPTSEREPDYINDTLGDAFPLQFPYGHTGLRGDPAVTELKEKTFRKRIDVFRKLLRHRKPSFHYPLFNLIIENLIMRDKIFLQTQITCNIKNADTTTMGEKFGGMDAEQFESAIQDSRNNKPVQFSSKAENQFLRSITTMCGKLPHSNEACMEARRVYFSFLMKFGIPAIFLTITPDDLRSFRIVVYALSPEKVSAYGQVDTQSFSESDILKEFNIRREARVQHPGLCAEEYQRLMQLVIKHFFNWDTESGKSKGTGLFGEVLAWCLATEEQGRKSLHGHYLVYIKNWNRVMNILQRKRNETPSTGDWTIFDANRNAKAMFANASSARLFSDFEVGKPLSEHPVFAHENCRSERNPKQMRFTVKPVPDQELRFMRHKQWCGQYMGRIASCCKCKKFFSVNGIIESALNAHLGNSDNPFHFPEQRCKPLDRIAYEMGKDFSWMNRTISEQSIRYFVGNAITNVHLTTHTQRCFKKKLECYANLPDGISESNLLVYNQEHDVWSNWFGEKERRFMLRFQPKRNIEDVFMNIHNPTITKLLMCNNNVQIGMNGRSILYSTGYQVKSQQKEERYAFEKVSNVLCKIIRKQASTTKHHRLYQEISKTNRSYNLQAEAEEAIPEHQQGFCRILAGIYTHTSGHIVGAPMAHYNAINESRFAYSHEASYLPVHGLEGILEKQKVSMRFRIVKGKQVTFHKALNYLYRPLDLNDMYTYKYYSETEYMNMKEAKKLNLVYFLYSEKHIFRDTEVVIKRKTHAVPSFPWNWLCSTKSFITTLLQPIDKNAFDYRKKQEYCCRFMILFVPFRTKEDLQVDGCYQKGFQKAHENGKFTKEVIEIAENIQTVHNSLASGIPENTLSAETCLIEEGDFDKNDEDDDTDNYDELMATMGELFGSLANGDGLKEDSKTFDLHYGNNQMDGTTVPVTALEDAIEISQHPENHGISYEIDYAAKRHEATKTELNTLAMSTTISRSQIDDNTERTVINANGTWQSISKWGENEGLDGEQQTAFEILAARYVLSFYEEAISETTAETYPAFIDNQQKLYQLTRRDSRDTEPLIMFITGPAGAGKCKS
jgi:hypothetical protein